MEKRLFRFCAYAVIVRKISWSWNDFFYLIRVQIRIPLLLWSLCWWENHSKQYFRHFKPESYIIFFAEIYTCLGWIGSISLDVKSWLIVAYQLHCNKNPIYVFLFWKLRGLSPNFHIHVSVSDLYIPRIWSAALTDTWMWKLGLGPRNSFSGNT